jgi:putative transposase
LSQVQKGDFGKLPIDVPRDRDSSFDPVTIPKGQTRFSGFYDKIILLYTRGMATILAMDFILP